MALRHADLTGLLRSVGVAILLVTLPARADAYCVHPAAAVEMRAAFPSLHIPVYLATGPNSSIAHVGVSQADAARVLMEVIARHNETVVAPKLHFAGFAPVDFTQAMAVEAVTTTNSIETWPSAIVVHGFPCNLLMQMDQKIHRSYVCNAPNRELHACAYRHSNKPGDRVGVVTLLPPHCQLAADSNISWSLDDSTQYDLAHTLLHELGHVLGLGHTNVEAADCSGIPGNDAAGNYGVMRTTRGASLAQLRHWRRDDLDGFDLLYANDYPDLELAHWRDVSFPDAVALEGASSLHGALVIRSGALGDAPQGMPQPVVSVDESRRVVFASLASDSSTFEAPGVIDPSPLGRTVGSPSVAVGDDGQTARVLVVWTADERSTNASMVARWALRDLLGGPWELSVGMPVTTSRLTAGFDAGAGLWLLAHLSEAGEPTLTLIDQDGDLLGSQVLPLVTWELSNPVCLPGAPTCTMMFSSSQLGGPNVGRIDFAIEPMAPGVQVQAAHVFAGQDVYGRSSLARAGVRLRTVAGRYRFELSAVDSEAAPMPDAPATMNLGDWPVELGAYAGTHRMAMPVAITCGDALLQSGEDCDDGNLIPGDGCDPQCVLEPDEVDGETGLGWETGDAETGDAGASNDEAGCVCRAAPGRPDAPGMALLGILGLAGIRRRPRAQNVSSRS